MDDPDVSCFAVLVEAREITGHTARTGFSAPTGWCGRITRESRVEELQGFVDEVCVVLEDAAVSGIGVELELGMW